VTAPHVLWLRAQLTQVRYRFVEGVRNEHGLSAVLGKTDKRAFGRTQRLTMLFAAAVGAMAVNAFFYGGQRLNIGQWLLASVYSVLIVSPIEMLAVFLLSQVADFGRRAARVRRQLMIAQTAFVKSLADLLDSEAKAAAASAPPKGSGGAGASGKLPLAPEPTPALLRMTSQAALLSHTESAAQMDVASPQLSPSRNPLARLRSDARLAGDEASAKQSAEATLASVASTAALMAPSRSELRDGARLRRDSDDASMADHDLLTFGSPAPPERAPGNKPALTAVVVDAGDRHADESGATDAAVVVAEAELLSTAPVKRPMRSALASKFSPEVLAALLESKAELDAGAKRVQPKQHVPVPLLQAMTRCQRAFVFRPRLVTSLHVFPGLLLLAYAGLCFYVVLAFGLQMGNDRTVEWFFSNLGEFLLSIMVLQPIKIGVMSMFALKCRQPERDLVVAVVPQQQADVDFVNLRFGPFPINIELLQRIVAESYWDMLQQAGTTYRTWRRGVLACLLACVCVCVCVCTRSSSSLLTLCV
jgi:hypothetical protein